MRALALFSVLLVLPLAGLVLLLALVTAPAPAVSNVQALTTADLEQGRRVWRWLVPRGLREGQNQHIVLTDPDLDRALAFLAGRARLTGMDAQARPQSLQIRISARVPGAMRVLQRPRYFNLTLDLVPSGAVLVPDRLRLGGLPLPSQAAGRLVGWLLDQSPLAPQYQLASQMLQSVRLGRDQVHVGFVWREADLEQTVARSAGVDLAALALYRQHLAQVGGRQFAPYLGAAFELARTRSASGDPVAENRVALTALAELVMGTRLAHLALAERAHQGRLGLAGRADFGQHFAFSAFMAATGGEQLADLVGLYKELQDARDGSGFSFTDLAADRAGSRLGQTATASAPQARVVQERLAGLKTHPVFFPKADDLPEYMPQKEFARRFGGVDAPPYRAMVEKIEARVGALALYR